MCVLEIHVPAPPVLHCTTRDQKLGLSLGMRLESPVKKWSGWNVHKFEASTHCTCQD